MSSKKSKTTKRRTSVNSGISSNKNTVKKSSGSTRDLSSTSGNNENITVAQALPITGRIFPLKLLYIFFGLFAAVMLFYFFSGYNNHAASFANAERSADTQMSSEEIGKDSNSTHLENNIDRTIALHFTDDALKKIYTGLSVQIIWLPTLVGGLFIANLILVMQSPESRKGLIVNGGLIVFFGIFILFVLSGFDEFTARALPQSQSDPLRKQITFISNVITIIQVAVGINILSTGLTMPRSKNENSNTTNEIKMLRNEIHLLRSEIPNWSKTERTDS